MNVITVTNENIETEHICCAIANNKDCQVSAKKSWLKERFQDGLVFKKCDVRGKCFIEYIPSENAWCPIVADNYMYINCFWVSGKLKGKGYANLLLEECIKNSKDKNRDGLVILSTKKKMPFLCDPKFLKYKGFQLADESEPYFELLYLPFHDNAARPKIKDTTRQPHITEQGFVLYYSRQCPYTAKYVPLIETIAQAKSVPFKAVRFETKEQAQNAPVLTTSYSLFYNGFFITNEILSESKFEKLIMEIELIK